MLYFLPIDSVEEAIFLGIQQAKQQGRILHIGTCHVYKNIWVLFLPAA